MEHNSSAGTRLDILIVTGHSGAGKSTVLRALEDIGFFCIDNLPITLFNDLYATHRASSNAQQPLALGIDVRAGQIDQLVEEIKLFKQQHNVHVRVIFLRSSTRILLRRFQETRRKHPLGDHFQLIDAIKQEKKVLKPLKVLADLTLATDHLSIHQLRNFIRTSFAPQGTTTMLVNLVSFGFKYGAPLECNFIYDVRSLPNPYFIPKLKKLKGDDPTIITFLFDQPETIEYWHHLTTFIRYSIEKSYQEGRFFITIAIGCTGGRHRSVAFVHKLAQLELKNVLFLVEHRDIARDNYKVR